MALKPNNSIIGEINQKINQLPPPSPSSKVKQDPYSILSNQQILGKVTFSRWRMTKNYFFGLDLKLGRLLCFKTEQSAQPSTYYTILKGIFLPNEQSGVPVQGSVIQIKSQQGKVFTMTIKQGKDIQKIKNYLTSCFELIPNKKSNLFFAMLGRAQIKIGNLSFNLVSGLIVGMESDVYSTTDLKQKPSTKMVMPKAGGLFFGTSNLYEIIIGGIFTIFENPDKYLMQKQEIKVDQQSLHKEDFLVGLIYKPNLGTLDVILMKKQEENNFTTLLERNVFQIVQKVLPGKKQQKSKKEIQKEQVTQDLQTKLQINSENLITLYENEEEKLAIRKNNNFNFVKQDFDQQLGDKFQLDNIDGAQKSSQIEIERSYVNRLLDNYCAHQTASYTNQYVEQVSQFMVLNNLVLLGLQKRKLENDEEFKNSKNEEDYAESEMEENKYIEEDEQQSICDEHNNKLFVNHRRIPLDFDRLIKNRFLQDQFDFEKSRIRNFRVGRNPFSPESWTEDYMNSPSKSSQIHTFSPESKNSNSQFKFNIINSPGDSDSNSVENHQLFVDKQMIENIRQKDAMIDGELVLMEQQDIFMNAPESQIDQSMSSYDDGLGDKNLDPNQEEMKIQSKAVIEEEGSENSSGSDEEDAEDVGIINAKETVLYGNFSKDEVQNLWEQWVILERKDEVRVVEAHKNGGKICRDKGIVSTSRSVGQQIMKEVGRQILSGDFNLTTVSFPIKAMVPQSALQSILNGTCMFPLFINRACNSADPVQRFKLVMTSTISNYIVSNQFLKPLNPILGETFEGSYPDGTKLYCQQISHHPPISYFLVFGPNQSYTYYGYYNFEAKAGFNSIKLINQGQRSIKFQDGSEVNYTFGYQYYSGTFMGDLKHETLGEITFTDTKNNLKANVVIGKVQKKPTDYVESSIFRGNTLVSKAYGSYLGFLQFDGKRYWDFRDNLPIRMTVQNSLLESDHSKRPDQITLIQGEVKKAQAEKEKLELLQRNDAQLRKKFIEDQIKAEKDRLKQQKKNQQQK